MGRVAVASMWNFFLLFLLHYPISETIFSSQSSHEALRRPLYDSLTTDFSDYIWPTDAGRLITSAFAEYRSTHFHGGIDISTGDNTGYRVFASRDGYISRILVWPTGYGKMLWVRHKDGYYTTYAHLNNFSDKIDQFVEDEQMRRECYPIDIECSPTDFPVKKGEVIAYTGETGTGSPHLHFEIRDENKNFVNPLLCKEFTFEDNIAPLLYTVGVTPIGETSLVNNDFSSYVVDFRRPVQGSTTLREPIYASGSIGFVTYARDRIDGSRFRNGVYRYKLFLDDSLIYSIQFDRAPASDNFQVGLYYDFALMSDEGGRIARLYVDSPNRLPFYQPQVENAGVINTQYFKEGPHSFRITASDLMENTSEVSGTIIFSHPREFTFSERGGILTFDFSPDQQMPELRLSTSLLSASGRVHWREEKLLLEGPTLPLEKISRNFDALRIEPRNKFGGTNPPRFFFPQSVKLPSGNIEMDHEVKPDFVRVFIRTNGAFTAPPTAVVLEGTSTQELSLFPLDYNLYAATFRPLADFHGKRTIITECEVNGRIQTKNYELILYPIFPGKSTQFSVDDGKLHIAVDSGSVFKPAYIEIENRSSDGETAYSLRPRHTVLDGGISVMLQADTLASSQALFYRRRGSWTLLSQKREGPYFVGELRRTLGDIAVMTDAEPPYVSRLRLPSSFSRQPHVVSFSVRDNFSGVEYESVKLYIDGKFAIPEIDGEHRRVKHRFVEPLKRGSHTLVILLKDRVGNSKEVHRTFTVR